MKYSRPALIAPSLLSCDLSRLNDEAQNMLDLGADWLHMDIMDNHFVPNLVSVALCLFLGVDGEPRRRRRNTPGI
jgi:pentose-5-phosphate-3-epimerase